MNIGCSYSIDDYETVEKPLKTSLDLPFGISIIATLLKQAKHDVEMFVICEGSDISGLISRYIASHNPKLFCLTAVSSQFHMMEKVAQAVKEVDPDIYVILGGHHASLASNNAIKCPNIDAICVGEGDQAIIELATQIASGKQPTGINNLWLKDKESGKIERAPRNPFNENLDTLPHIDRTMWESWVMAPYEEVSVLVGRGCPYKCTYCSNHAMEVLSPGKYVRYRSPRDMIEEIDTVCHQYHALRDVYLEVETIGASMWNALELFQALAEYNSSRAEKINFRMNLAIHSSFVKREDRVREFFEHCRNANVVTLNVGLESGSERIRTIMRRPHYSNKEIIEFSAIAREYGVAMSLYVLLGLPDETPADFMQTVKVVREIQPDSVLLAIFYPYVGTDLYETCKERGLIPVDGLEPAGERRRALLNLPEFPRWRLRMEYVLFWFRAYRGIWSMPKILARMGRSYLAQSPRLDSVYRYLRTRSKLIKSVRRQYTPGGVLKT